MKEENDLTNSTNIILGSLMKAFNYSIWSINKEYMLTSYNDSFKKGYEKIFKRNIEIGDNIFKGVPKATVKFWTIFYERGFKGEKSIVEIPSFGEYLELNINPILEKGEIVGVLVLSKIVTERKKSEERIKKTIGSQFELIQKIKNNEASLSLLKEMAEYKLEALHSVMNSHFLFNCLNSIQYFIGKNERKLALDYLSSFSNLIRKTLDSSIKSTITARQAIEILELYVGLEALRFEDEFDFKITLEPSLNLDEIEIPTLLIQPYVENAILRGLRNKGIGKGYLKVNVYQKNGCLIFTIQDNGGESGSVGVRKEKNNTKENTYGTHLNPERLEMIAQASHVSIKEDDLIDNKGALRGTIVEIRIKI